MLDFKKNQGVGSWLFYTKPNDGEEAFSSAPPGNIDVGRLIAGLKDFFVKTSISETLTQKTLLITDWALARRTGGELDIIKQQISKLLGSKPVFKVYLWQETGPIEIALETISLLDNRNTRKACAPTSIDNIKRTMADIGVTTEALALLDSHTLGCIEKDSISPCIVNISDLAESEFSLSEIFSYLENLELDDIIFNQDICSVKQRDWLNQHIDELRKHGGITFDYKKIILNDELIGRQIEFSGESAFSFNTLDSIQYLEIEPGCLKIINESKLSLEVILRKASYLKTISLRECGNLDEILQLEGVKLEALEEIDLSKSNISSDNLSALLKAAPNRKKINLDNCKNLSKALQLEGVKLEALKEIYFSNSNTSSENLSALLKAAPNLKKICLNNCQNLGEALQLEGIKLEALKEIYFSSSNISSENLSALLKAAPNLKKICLNNCQNLSEALQLEGVKLEALEEIDLSYSHISSDNICALLKVAPNLKKINLACCKNLSEILELEGIKLEALEEIDLSGSNISSDNICALLKVAPNLKKINLACCQNLSEILELEGVKLEVLQEANLSYSNISIDNLIALLKAAPNLKAIDLNDCQNLSEIPELEGVKLEVLQEANLSYSNISIDNLIAQLKAAPNLKKINLAGCQNLSEILELEGVKLEVLQEANLSYSNISSDNISALLKAAPNLKKINLTGCKNLSEILELEGIKLEALEEVNLSHYSHITSDNLIALLKAAPNLKAIDLTGCQNLSEIHELEGVKLEVLQEANLSYSNISIDSLIAQLKATPNLKKINLVGCKNLSEILELEGIKLEALEEIDLSYSNISKDSLEALLKAAPKLKRKAVLKQWEENEMWIHSHAYSAPFVINPNSSSSSNAAHHWGTPPIASNPTYSKTSLYQKKEESRPQGYQKPNACNQSQGSIIEQLCQYLTVTKQYLDLIPDIRSGICNPLSHIFISRAPGEYQDMVQRILAWFGTKESLTQSLQADFKLLLQAYQASKTEFSPKSYVGDNLQDFIKQHAKKPFLFSNPIHQVACQYVESEGYYLYDPNFIDGPHKISKEEALYTEIVQQLGTVISVEGVYGINPSLSIQNKDKFLLNGGFLLLAKSHYRGLLNHMQSTQGPLEWAFAIFKTSALTLNALKGLFALGADNTPAWVLGLINRKSKPFFEKCIRDFITKRPDYRQQFKESLSALNAKTKDVWLKVVDNIAKDVALTPELLQKATQSLAAAKPPSVESADVDTTFNPDKTLYAKQTIICLDKENVEPTVDNYRIKCFDHLTLGNAGCGIASAFTLSNENDIEFIDKKVELVDCDLGSLGRTLNQSLSQTHYLGRINLSLNQTWQALPSLTPFDAISHLSVNPKADVEIRYSKRDNLYYIRAKNEGIPSVDIEYLFTVATPKKTLKLPTAIARLVRGLNQFGQGALAIEPQSASGKDYLAAMKEQRVGACRHRAVLFKSIMDEQYPDISCRIISNDCHAYAEACVDGTWFKCDLGGYPANLIIEPAKKISLPEESQKSAAHHQAARQAIKQAQALKEAKALHQTLTAHYRKSFARTPIKSVKAQLAETLAKVGKKHLLQCQGEASLNQALINLYEEAIQSGRPIFWVKEPHDLLCQRHFIKKEGDKGLIKKGPGGTLYNFLIANKEKNQKPILLIDYSDFKASDVVKFNSLLDDTQKADGVSLPSDLTIIGLQNSEDKNHYNGQDFISRFDSKHVLLDFEGTQKPDTSQPMDVDDDNQPYIINLYHALDWQQRLLGRWGLKGQDLTFIEGALKKALLSGKPITILNPPKDRNYSLLLEQLSIEGQFEGVPFDITHIHHKEGYDAIFEAEYSHYASYLSEDDWHKALVERDNQPTLLNPISFAALFSTFSIEGGQIDCQEGLLIKHHLKHPHQPLTLYLSRDLNLSQWGELLDKASDYEITLDIRVLPGVKVAEPAQEALKIEHQAIAAPVRIFSYTEMLYKSPLVITSDMDVTAQKLKMCDDTLIIDISETDVAKRFVETKGEFNKENLTFHFSETERLLLRELEAGRRIILKGPVSAEKLDRLLPYLYLYQKQLTLVVEDNVLTPNAPYRFDTVTFKQKCELLTQKKDVFDRTLLANLKDESDEFLFPLSELKALPYARLEALARYQAINPDSRDIKAPWRGLITLNETAVNSDINLLNVEQDTELFIQKRIDDIDCAIATSPIAFISGVTGTGKSAFIERHLKPIRPVYDYSDIESWANDQNGGILFIDEANISNKQYSEFEGLFESPPYILLNDTLIPLSPYHRVLFAGNPLSYGGSRTLPRLFERHAQTVIFEPLAPNVLFELIIKPLLENTPFMHDAFTLTMPLLEAFQFLLKKENAPLKATPRDAKAIVMRALSATDNAKSLDEAKDNFTLALKKQIHLMLSPKVPKHRISAFIQKFPLPEIKDTTFKLDNNFVITESRLDVADAINNTLALRNYRVKYQERLNQSQKFGDISAIVIESEPGLGKTMMVNALLKHNGLIEGDINRDTYLKQVFYNIPATLSIKQKKCLLLKAFVEGNVVIIDEINSTPMLEQFVNNLLMGQIPQDDDIKDSPWRFAIPSPGFILIGSQNPIYMAGRVKSSEAEDARRLNFRLPHYTKPEMLEILDKLEVDPLNANAMVDAYLTERSQARQRKDEVIPNFRDLLRLAGEIVKQKEQGQAPKVSAAPHATIFKSAEAVGVSEPKKKVTSSVITY